MTSRPGKENRAPARESRGDSKRPKATQQDDDEDDDAMQPQDMPSMKAFEALFEKHTDQLTQKLGSKIDVLSQTLSKHEEQLAKHSKELEGLHQALASTQARLAAAESRPSAPAPPAPPTPAPPAPVTAPAPHSDPANVRAIVGGFPRDTHRTLIEKTVEDYVKDKHDYVYITAPSLYGSVCLVHFADAFARDAFVRDARARNHFDWKFQDKALWISRAKTAMQRRHKLAVDILKSAVAHKTKEDQLEIDYSTLYWQGLRIAKYDDKMQPAKVIWSMPKLMAIDPSMTEQQWDQLYQDEVKAKAATL